MDTKYDEASDKYADVKGYASEKSEEAETAGKKFWNKKVEDAKVEL